MKRLGYAWTVVWMTFSIRFFFLPASFESLYPIVDPEWVEKLLVYFPFPATQN